MLCIILAAGLWPFNPYPTNKVRWVPNDNAVQFDGQGAIYSVGTFKASNLPDEAPISLEIWLRPKDDRDTHTILAFSTPGNPEQFSIRQYLDGLLVQRKLQGFLRQQKIEKLDIDHVFRGERQALIAITSGLHGVAIYLDGRPLSISPDFRLTTADFTGQFILGTSPVRHDAWSGQLRGVAVYNYELTSAQVLRHYETWTRNGRPEPLDAERTVALYLFHEGVGRTIRNQVISGPDLFIQQGYSIYRKTLLEVPRKLFRVNSAYLSDVLINVVGFIPFGLFFCAYLSLVRHSDWAASSSTILGGIVSLTIEILQVFLPTRSSDMTDVVANTIGAGIGAALYTWSRRQTDRK
jgi:VanZ family protein